LDRTALVLIALVSVAASACSSASPAGPQNRSAGAQPTAAPEVAKSLVVAIPSEPEGFGEMFAGGNSGPEHLQAMLHRDLVQPDERGTYIPEVAADLPSQEKGTWTILPDGRMNTIWELKPNVLWHDGGPLRADDVFFSWQVAIAPDVPYKQRDAAKLIEGIQILDTETFVIHWKSFYVGADRLTTRDLFLLPRHILESTFVDDRTAFVNSSFWTTDFVGVGPYRLVSWIPGSSAQLQAFDRFFGNQPHIQNVTVRFIPDSNTELASILGGNTDVQLGRSLGLEHALLLSNQWESTGAGRVITYPRGIFEIRFAAGDPRVADLRVRQALYHAMDRQGIVDNLYRGKLEVANSFANPRATEFADVDPQITKYPYDPARAATLLAETGWRKAGDGILRNDRDEPYTLPFSTTASNQERDQLQSTVADMWRTAGFDVQIENVPLSVQNSASYDFATTDLSGVNADFEPNLPRIDGRNLKTPQNPRGANVWGYANPEVDDLIDQWQHTTDKASSVQLEGQILHRVSEDLPILPINYRIEVITVRKGVTGVPQRSEATGNNSAWNIEDWDIT